jgi:hypothetical protein
VGRRRHIAIGLVASLLLVAGYLVWRAFPRDRPAPAQAGEALREFRRRAARPIVGRPGEPGPGVYRYATRGGESVDAVAGVLRADHDYSGVSTIAVIPTACGAIERWQALESRWMEIASCMPRARQRLLAVDELHEFFGTRREVTYRCREPLRPSATLLRPGMRWRGRCRTEDGSRESRFRVLGFEPVRVGGGEWEAVHTRTDYRMRGEYSGWAADEEWRRRSDGLLLRRTSRTRARSDDPIPADYEERYSIRLLSTRPVR